MVCRWDGAGLSLLRNEVQVCTVCVRFIGGPSDSRTSPIELAEVRFRLVFATNLRRCMRADPPDLAFEEHAGDVAVLLASGAQQGDGIRGPLGGLDEGLHGLGWRHLRDGAESGGKRKEPEGGKTVKSGRRPLDLGTGTPDRGGRRHARDVLDAGRVHRWSMRVS